MSTGIRAAVVAGLIIAATFAMRWVNPLTAIGDIKSDEATYVSMALSLVHDGNLTFEKADLDRFVAIYPRGPEGIFLKRQYELQPSVSAAWPFVHLNRSPVPTSERLAYGKAFIYPLVAAPFVAMGGVSGLLVFNVVLLGVCLFCAIRFCQAQAGRLAGAIIGVGFLLFSVTPVYFLWLMPEPLNLTLIFVALFLWLYKFVAPTTVWPGWRSPTTDVMAAVLLGVATYSKPSHLIFVGSMVFASLIAREWRRALTVGVVAGIVTGALFSANVWTTGQANYQGAADGDLNGRKSFYEAFPFDSKGTQYEMYGSDQVTNDTGSVNTETSDVFRLLPLNAWYFVVGRDAGLVPFFFPGLAIAMLWLVRIRRTPSWQLAVALGVLGSAVAFLIITPYSWNGAGGPPGNRYFLSSYPAMLFLIPPGAGWLLAVVTSVGALFTAPMVVSPLQASLKTWLTVERAPFTWLPVELTLANDLPVDLLPQERARIPFSQNPVVLFYYLDGNAKFLEENKGQWIGGDSTADIMIRTEVPLTKVTLDIEDKYVVNDVTVTLMDDRRHLHLEPGKKGTLVFHPTPGVWAHASYGVVLRISTTNGFVPAKVEATPPGQTPDTRFLGVFVKYAFEVAEKPPGG